MPLERSGYCSRCRRHVLARERQFNTKLHAALSVLTCFLWLPVAALAGIVHALDCAVRGGYLCSRCGARVR